MEGRKEGRGRGGEGRREKGKERRKLRMKGEEGKVKVLCDAASVFC